MAILLTSLLMVAASATEPTSPVATAAPVPALGSGAYAHARRTRLRSTRLEIAGIATTAVGLGCLSVAAVDLAFLIRSDALPQALMPKSPEDMSALVAFDVLALAGLLSVATGGVMWGIGAHDAVAVAVAPTPDGATLVVGGRF